MPFVARSLLLGSCCLSNESLTLVFVAFPPVVALAINGAVKPLLALRALLVLHRLTLGRRAETADLKQGFTLVLCLVVHGLLERTLLLKPIQGRVVHPGVENVD